jgi:hypothetical protein
MLLFKKKQGCEFVNVSYLILPIFLFSIVLHKVDACTNFSGNFKTDDRIPQKIIYKQSGCSILEFFEDTELPNAKWIIDNQIRKLESSIDTSTIWSKANWLGQKLIIEYYDESEKHAHLAHSEMSLDANGNVITLLQWDGSTPTVTNFKPIDRIDEVTNVDELRRCFNEFMRFHLPREVTSNDGIQSPIRMDSVLLSYFQFPVLYGNDHLVNEQHIYSIFLYYPGSSQSAPIKCDNPSSDLPNPKCYGLIEGEIVVNYEQTWVAGSDIFPSNRSTVGGFAKIHNNRIFCSNSYK